MEKLPTLFISHGAPTYALEPGTAGPQLTALGRSLPRPEAVLVVSPHWTTHDVQVGTARRIQPVDATHSLNISAGVWKPSVLRSLSFNCRAIALSWSCE